MRKDFYWDKESAIRFLDAKCNEGEDACLTIIADPCNKASRWYSVEW